MKAADSDLTNLMHFSKTQITKGLTSGDRSASNSTSEMRCEINLIYIKTVRN